MAASVIGMVGKSLKSNHIRWGIDVRDARPRDPIIRTVPQPADMNGNGDIFGGWVLSQMDIAGGTLAARVAKGRVATVAITAMTFVQPIKVGDLVSIYGEVSKVGRTSITIALETIVQRRLDPTPIQVTHGTFVFVAIDEDGKPRQVSPGMRARPIAGATGGGRRCVPAWPLRRIRTCGFRRACGDRHGERRLHPCRDRMASSTPMPARTRSRRSTRTRTASSPRRRLALLVRDTMPELQKFGFLTWLNTGDKDFSPPKVPAFTARIDDPATFTPPDWDRGGGRRRRRCRSNKRQTMSLPPKPRAGPPRNLVYTMRFELPQPVKSFSITTYDPDDYMRVEVDKESLPAGCTLDKHPTYKSEFVPGQPVFADRVTCRLP